jgi:hypothetical protein
MFAFRVWFVFWPFKKSIFVFLNTSNCNLRLQCSLILNNWCKACIHKTFIRPRHCIISCPPSWKCCTNTIRPLRKEVKHDECIFLCITSSKFAVMGNLKWLNFAYGLPISVLL